MRSATSLDQTAGPGPHVAEGTRKIIRTAIIESLVATDEVSQ
jgi:hypothetical protein